MFALLPPLPRRTGRLAACLALALAASPAIAADFDGPYGPPRPPEPAYEPARPYPPPSPPVPEYHRPRFSAGPAFGPPPEINCRVFVKRRFDAYGEPVLRRVKVCDEGPSFGPPPPPRPVGFDGPPPEGGPGWRWRPHW